MTKDEIKNLLESYKFEVKYYNERRTEADIVMNNIKATIKVLNNIKDEVPNKDLVKDLILSYTKDVLKIENNLAEINLKIKSIENLIENVSQPYRNVLHYKYIVGLSVEQIADKMNYSTQRIYQLHEIGINEIIEKEDVG